MNCALTSALNSDSKQEMKGMYLWAPFHFKGWRDWRENACGEKKLKKEKKKKKKEW